MHMLAVWKVAHSSPSYTNLVVHVQDFEPNISEAHLCILTVRGMWFWPRSRKCFFMVEIDKVKIMHGTNCEERFEWLDKSRK